MSYYELRDLLRKWFTFTAQQYTASQLIKICYFLLKSSLFNLLLQIELRHWKGDEKSHQPHSCGQFRHSKQENGKPTQLGTRGW